MKTMKFLSNIALSVSLSIALTACSLRAPYPKRQQYLLSVSTPKKMGYKMSLDTLQVPETVVLPPFSDTNFVYRTSDMHYINDFYNALMEPPSTNIHQLILQSLKATHLFQYVTSGNRYLRPNYILTSQVLALYADYRDSNHPKGIISIQFALFKPKHKGHSLLFEKTFTQKIPLCHKDSISLVRAWNHGFQKILSHLAYRLRGVTFD